MGLSSAAAIDGAQLCVFDLRRGQQEGQELDKILFFHPADCPILLQLSVIGLCEGIITFTRIFSPEDDCEVIESDRHSHVFYQAEPDIWMVLVVEKTKDSESTLRFGALQGILKESHSLFTMFHGPIRALLDRQPSAELARGHLHTFVTDYLSDFIVGKKLQLPTYRDSLTERGTVQMLTVSREVALEVQSLTAVLGSCLGNVICQSIVLFEDLLVSTTLPPDDTLNLYTYAILRLTPRALYSNANSWSYLRKGAYVNAGPASSSSNGAATAERPLQREKLSKGKDGFVAADFATTEVRAAVPLTPILWFQQAEERMYLCSGYIFYFHLNSLTNKKEVLYVITVDTIHTPKVKYNPKHYSDLFSFARGLFLPGLYFATRYYKNRNTFSKFYSANKTSLMKAKHFYSGCGLLCTM